ncbi:hypothetical protein [Nocardioides sp. SYSU DS0651]|uniref:hypothetical protein n=1 Tax=Nocardioides sp. SYSU DS0651 TaxID=3415955 RepID=UPI003F4BC4F0
MQTSAEVHVRVEGTTVPGLVLKWNAARDRALVTFDDAGTVRTQWLASDDVYFDVEV